MNTYADDDMGRLRVERGVTHRSRAPAPETQAHQWFSMSRCAATTHYRARACMPALFAVQHGIGLACRQDAATLATATPHSYRTARESE